MTLALVGFYLGGAIASTVTMAVQDDVDWVADRGFLAGLFLGWPLFLPLCLAWSIADRSRRAAERRATMSEQRPSAASGMRAGCPADAAPSPAGRSSKAEDRR